MLYIASSCQNDDCMPKKKGAVRKEASGKTTWSAGVHDRIRHLVKEQGSNKKFAELLSKNGLTVDPRRVTDWVGARLPTAENLYQIARATNCSLDWLLGLREQQYIDQFRTKNELVDDLETLLRHRVAQAIGCEPNDMLAFGDLILEELIERQIKVLHDNHKWSQIHQVLMEMKLRLDPEASSATTGRWKYDAEAVNEALADLKKSQHPLALVVPRTYTNADEPE